MRNKLALVSYRDRESEKIRERKRKGIVWRHSQKRKRWMGKESECVRPRVMCECE
jgi:hypothetical protein